MSEQRTEEWFKERLGKITASNMGAVLKFSRAYIEKIRGELSGKIQPNEVDAPALEWGRINEPRARAAYELRTWREVRLAGFTRHPEIDYVGGSVDGFVDPDGIIEIKCPHDTTNHLATIHLSMPHEHSPQVQGLLWVTGRQWCDFVSFDPRVEYPRDLYIKRVHRDDLMIRRLELACARFWQMVREEETDGIPNLF